MGQLHFLAKWISKTYLQDLPYPEKFREKINVLKEHGHIIYVHPSENILWHLALEQTLVTQNLPQAEFSAGIPKRRLQPYFGLFQKKSELLNKDSLKKNMEDNKASELFLRPPASVFAKDARSTSKWFLNLVEIQKDSTKPVYLVPHFLALKSRPSQFEKSAADRVFGTSNRPGFIRALWRIIFGKEQAQWVVFDEINLAEFMGSLEGKKDEVIAQKLRWALIKSMRSLERSALGPALKSHQRMRQNTLRDPKLRQFMENVHNETGVPLSKLRAKARRYFDELAARFDMDVTVLLDRMLSLVWSRIYSGLFISEEDKYRLRENSKLGPLVIIPSHRSHVDYLVMSQLLYKMGLLPPHIAAGDNLSFFPLGSIFRRGGAYFIRRSFHGDPLYPRVVRAYIRRLFIEGYAQEFFIEGSRSRSGKSLTPKLGLLSIMFDSLLELKKINAVFIPASVTYENLIEDRTFQKELLGGEKKKESASSLLGMGSILKKRYGKVYVRFGEPIPFHDFLASQGISLEDGHPKDTPALVVKLANQVMNGIDRSFVVTTNALVACALFGAKRRLLSKAHLHFSAKQILRRLASKRPEAPILNDELNESVRKALGGSLAKLVTDGLIVEEQSDRFTYYQLPQRSALILDGYKNTLMHHFITDALLALSFLAAGGNRRAVERGNLRSKYVLFYRIFFYEFNYPHDKSDGELFEESLERLIESGKINFSGLQNEKLSLSKEGLLETQFLSRQVSGLVDSYLVCFNRMRRVLDKHHSSKAIINGFLGEIKDAYMRGSIDSPEAVSKATAKNALSLFSKESFTHKEGTKTKISPIFDEEHAQNFRVALQEAHYNRLSV